MKYNNLRRIREQKEMSQQTIANHLNITRQQYHLYESGKREIPTQLLVKLCQIYKVPCDYILDVQYDDIDIDFDIEESLENIRREYLHLINLTDKPEWTEDNEYWTLLRHVQNAIQCAEIDLQYYRSKNGGWK